MTDLSRLSMRQLRAKIARHERNLDKLIKQLVAMRSKKPSR